MECGTAVADYPVRQMVTSHPSGGAQGAVMKRIALSGVILTISGLAFAAYPGSNVQAAAIRELLTVPEAGALFLFASGFIGLVSYRRFRRMQ